MKIVILVVLGVWALFWGACAVSAVAGGDVLGMVAFAVIGGLPWLWSGEILSKAVSQGE